MISSGSEKRRVWKWKIEGKGGALKELELGL